MRPKERIPIFLKLVDWNKLLVERWEIKEINGIEFKSRSNDYYKHVFEDEWLKVPDQRIGQLMINSGFLPDQMNIWMDEEHDILHDQGIDTKEFLLWGVNFDKDRNKLPETQWKLCTELETDHIAKILDEVNEGLYVIGKLYTDTFESILDERKRKEIDKEIIKNTKSW